MRTKSGAVKSEAKPASKRASKQKQLPNGGATPKTPTLFNASSKIPDHSTLKSPTAQPAELSESDRQRLRQWLDLTDRPFAVQTIPASRKRKRGANQLQVQDDIFEDRLSVQYEVKPRDKWESLRRYKKFTGKRIRDRIKLCEVADRKHSWLRKHRNGRMHTCQARRKRRSESRPQFSVESESLGSSRIGPRACLHSSKLAEPARGSGRWAEGLSRQE